MAVRAVMNDVAAVTRRVVESLFTSQIVEANVAKAFYTKEPAGGHDAAPLEPLTPPASKIRSETQGFKNSADWPCPGPSARTSTPDQDPPASDLGSVARLEP